MHTRWEYAIEAPHADTISAMRAYEAAGGLVGALNRLGQDGWELVAITANRSLVLKRPQV